MFLAGARIDAGVGADFEDTKIAGGFGADLFPRLNHFGFAIYDLRASRKS
jgi:hypothetical protein